MIFAHTLPQVLSGEKTQTARIWKPYYRFGGYDGEVAVISQPSGSYLYYVGGVRSVQPGRGKKSVARIRITKLWKQNILDYTDLDIYREGFQTLDDFLQVWSAMHGVETNALCIQFELVSVAETAVE